jgi:hypothetical protein
MTRRWGYRKFWPATTLGVALIATVTAAPSTTPNRGARPTSEDCHIVGELVRQWQSTVSQAGTWLEHRFSGDAELATVVEARRATAAEIRGRISQVHSPAIAVDLYLWADGLEKMADAQRTAIDSPKGDPDGLPQDYIQGALDSFHAGEGFMAACPSTAGTSELA